MNLEAKTAKLKQLVSTVEIPTIWKEVAGILRGNKRVDGLKYQRQVRKEWPVNCGN